jgi:branched-chain amino acid aminotransferase
MHPLMLYGDEIVPHSSRVLSPGQTGVMNGWGVFSTLRAAKGVLFEYHRHWLRMKQDADALGVEMPCSEDELELRLLKLLEANKCPEATVRVSIIRNYGGAWDGHSSESRSDLVGFTAPLKDWGADVALGVQPNARFAANEFVGAKVLSWCMNLAWLERANKRGMDEVLLLNEHGQVAECTSANVFAKFGNRVLTPPLSSGCLPGITRQLLLDTVRVEGYTMEEAPLTVEDLEQADVCFISSSTRNVLAVRSIEGKPLRQDPAFVDAWANAFEEHLQEYVRTYPRRASIPAE